MLLSYAINPQWAAALVPSGATLAGGDSVEGLYFLRSDVDRSMFGACGNALTDFRFHAPTSHLGLIDARLVRATQVAPIDDVWRTGRIERIATPCTRERSGQSVYPTKGEA